MPKDWEGDVNQSSARAEYQRRCLGETSRELLNADARVYLHQGMSTPCLNGMRAADGAHIEDLEGRRYLDFHGNSVHQVGFGNSAVIDAIKTQLDDLSFCTRRFTNQVAVDFAQRLVELAPASLTRVLLAPGGTLAMGMAIKLARLASGRHKTIAAWGSFHGASLDMIGVGGSHDMRHDIGPLMGGAIHVPYPETYRSPWGGDPRESASRCAHYIETILEREGDVAAVVFETVRGDMTFPEAEFWTRVRAACDRHGTLLILDEIPWSLGRSGHLFAFEAYGIEPDILVLGKGLGGGVFPLAALLAREELNCAKDHSIGHYTHEKNPVACAAGLATLNCIVDHELPARARELGSTIVQPRLESLTERFNFIGDTRARGLMFGIELVKDRASRERASEEAERVLYAALERGLSFKIAQGNVLAFAPPLTIEESDLQRALDIVEECFGELV
ncbi:MAG: aspartate aminotransferase family protein [Planctomycetota bacterium]